MLRIYYQVMNKDNSQTRDGSLKDKDSG